METTRNDPSLDDLETEAWDSAGVDLDLRSTAELVSLINAADATVPAAVGAAHDSLVEAIDAVVVQFERGGRLVYVGAGTSGLLAHADAVECRATFGIEEGRVVAVVAGGIDGSASWREAEDDAAAGAEQIRILEVGAADAVVGVSASGRTPFVVGALEEARQAGAITLGVVCVADSELAATAHHEICVPTGPEVLAGSTRLKAGTAQKLVLNTISTVSMIRLGTTFGNLMVDVVASNEKLRARVRRIVLHASGATPERVDAALAEADGEAKVAIVMLVADVDARSARERLARAGGVVRRAIAP